MLFKIVGINSTSLWNSDLSLSGRLQVDLLERKDSTSLQSPDGIVYSAEDKYEIYTDSVEEQFNIHRVVCDLDHSAVVADSLSGYFFYLSPPIEDFPNPFDLADVKLRFVSFTYRRIVSAQRHCHTLPHFTFLVYELYDRYLRLHYIPSLWKCAKIVMIPKPSKLRVLRENHRSIYLFSVISKVLQRLLYGQIVPLFDDNVWLLQRARDGPSTCQGYCPTDGHGDKHHYTLAVLLDVSKVFDRASLARRTSLQTGPAPICSLFLQKTKNVRKRCV